MNIDGEARPHVLADINLAPFKNEVFGEVYFERVPFSAFVSGKSQAINESARILSTGGRIVIETGSLAPVEEIKRLMKKVGFTYMRVKELGLLRITARKSDKP